MVQPFEQRRRRRQLDERLAGDQCEPAQQIQGRRKISLLQPNLGEAQQDGRRDVVALNLPRIDEFHDLS